jgi:ketosteroid isomerase-like protein
MIIITTVDHHVKQVARGGSVGERETGQLADSLQVQAIKADYCETVDICIQHRDQAATRLGELFTDDVRADYGLGPLSGREAVIAFLLDAIVSNNESLWHSIHTPHIDVSGDTARAQWTVMVRMRHKGAGASDVLYGRYVDELRRTPRGWLISSIRFIQEG